MNGKSLKRVTALLALLAFAFTALVLTVLPVRAAGPTLQADPMDNPLTISRMLTTSTSTFGGNIRLTAIGGDISNLRLLASDLQMMNNACPSTPSSQAASTMIDRSNISIPAGILLKDGQPTDVLVTITNVTHPGTYCGFLDFYDGQTGTKLLTVPLTLSISVSPNVISLDDTVNVQVVHSQWPEIFDNFLVNIVLSNSYEQDNWTVRLLNETLVPVNILGMTLDLKGDKTGVDYSDAFPNVQFPISLPANQTKQINFMIKRNLLPPDHYHGMIRLILENSDTAVKVPVDVNLRNGPFWTIVILIFGILLGQLAISLYSPTAIKQNALREHTTDLSSKLSWIKDSSALLDVSTKLDNIKRQIYTTNNDDRLTALGDLLNKLDHRFQFYQELDGLKERVEKYVPDNEDKQTLLQEINTARSSMERIPIEGDMSDADKQKDNATNKLIEWLNQHQYQQEAVQIKAFITYVQPTEKPTRGGEVRRQPSAARSPIMRCLKWLWDKIMQVWHTIRGTQAQRAERRDVWIRPSMKWILVIVLALIGLQTFYLSNATFGASGLSDYLPLFLWGFGANVAGSTFQNLPLPSSRG